MALKKVIDSDRYLYLTIKNVSFGKDAVSFNIVEVEKKVSDLGYNALQMTRGEHLYRIPEPMSLANQAQAGKDILGCGYDYLKLFPPYSEYQDC